VCGKFNPAEKDFCMSPRLKKAIARTAEFTDTSEGEVADLAADGLERSLADAEKQVKAKFKSAIKRVTIGAAVKKRAHRATRNKPAAVAA
jgi:hypothetical protein